MQEQAAGHFAVRRYTDAVRLNSIMDTRTSRAQTAVAEAEAAERKFKTASARAKQLKQKSREAKRLHKEAKKNARRAAKASRAAHKVAEKARRDYKKATARATKVASKAAKAARANATIVTPRKASSQTGATSPAARRRTRRVQRTHRGAFEVGEDTATRESSEASAGDRDEGV